MLKIVRYNTRFFINHVGFYLVIMDVCTLRLSDRSASDYLVETKGILVHPSSEETAICRQSLPFGSLFFPTAKLCLRGARNRYLFLFFSFLFFLPPFVTDPYSLTKNEDIYSKISGYDHEGLPSSFNIP